MKLVRSDAATPYRDPVLHFHAPLLIALRGETGTRKPPQHVIREKCLCAAPAHVHSADEVPAAVKQEVGPSSVGCVAPRRPDALLAHALRLHSAGGEELNLFVREGRRDWP